MNGKELRLQRILARSDKLMVAAMDHGGFGGPISGLEDPAGACRKMLGADAILMMPGMIPLLAENFTSPGSPLIITRLLWHSAYCFQWKYHESQHKPMLTAAQAVAKGADIVLASLSLKTGSERVDAENAGFLSQCIQQAHELGVPIVGEFFPSNVDQMPREELHELIQIGCRAVAELGADMIKTFYTGDRFAEIVKSTPIPILVLGAEKTPTEQDALALAQNAVKAGARGIVFGRNIFQSRNPSGFIEAVRAVMSSRCSIDEAVKTYNLQ